MHPIFPLLLGIVCAGVGGEFFVRGSVGLAKSLRISAGIIGATVAAFATSSPELAVAISAARGGAPEIALGDALGSNVSNIGLILAIALLFTGAAGLRAPRDDLKRDFPLALSAPLVLAVFAFDGFLSRLEGAILLLVFIAWLVGVTLAARRERSNAGETLSESGGPARAIFSSVFGLILLVGAGHFIVSAAKGFTDLLGWDEFLVGVTLVAAATSTPELATVIVAKLRGHDEVGLGTILGSNIFNGLFIVGVTATLAPISFRLLDIGLALGFGFALVLAAYPLRGETLTRTRGVFLLALYGAFVGAVLHFAAR